MRLFKKGISIVELVIAVGLIGVSVVGIILAFNTYTFLSIRNSKEIQTAILIEETAEVIQILRDSGWDDNITNLSNDTKYYLVWNGTSYVATTTVQSTDNLIRSFTLFEVERDSSDDITNNGSVDPDTRKVLIEVSWIDSNGINTRSSEMYIHNIYQN